MAEIKMDVTEYELMKDKARLLEESLKREKELNGQIAKLKDEKIQALEDAKYKVVTVTKTEHTEHTLAKVSNKGELVSKLKEILVHLTSNHPYLEYANIIIYEIYLLSTTPPKKHFLNELGIIWSTEGYFLKKPYRNNLNEALSWG